MAISFLRVNLKKRKIIEKLKKKRHEKSSFDSFEFDFMVYFSTFAWEKGSVTVSVM